MAGHGTQPRRFLVVDDNEDAADTLAMLLELAGHEARRAYSPTEALRELGAFDPEIILLDLDLPEMTGCTLASIIRERLAGNAVILAVTAHATAEYRRRTAAAGFDEHLVKPVALPAIYAAVQRREEKEA